MNPFSRKENRLYIEDVAVEDITRQCATPFYVYSAAALRDNYHAFKEAAGATARICYSVKANSNQAVLRILAHAGAGADIVSEGEGRRALAAGISADRIFFSGAGKTITELRFALEAGLAQINVESADELERLIAVATEMKKTATIALRVNPDIAAGGHDKIATGRANNKFGVSFAETEALYRHACAQPMLDVSGLAVHIGSQITSLDVFEKAFNRLGELAQSLRDQGLAVRQLDLGGGLGIDQTRDLTHDIENYGALVARVAQKMECEIVLSPGRALVGQAGCLVASVIEEKKAGDSNLLILDAAMNDLLRPTLYNAYHPVEPLALSQAPLCCYELVGPICETGDVLGRNISLPQQKSGALLAIMQVGAYGAVLSSSYNSRLLVPEILVEGERVAIIRARPTYADLIALDTIPDWFEK